MQDFRGPGGSVRDNLAGLSTFASDIEDMADVMGLTNTVVVGHSMGALVAVSLASGRLKPKGLVLISGSLQPASPELTRITARFAALSLPQQSGDLDPIFSKDHRDILHKIFALAQSWPFKMLDTIHIGKRPRSCQGNQCVLGEVLKSQLNWCNSLAELIDLRCRSQRVARRGGVID